MIFLSHLLSFKAENLKKFTLKQVISVMEIVPIIIAIHNCVTQKSNTLKAKFFNENKRLSKSFIIVDVRYLCHNNILIIR